MNTLHPRVVPIFASPFAVVALPEALRLNLPVTELFRLRSGSAAAADATSTPLCYRSREDLLEWTDEPVRQLCQQILHGVRSVVAALNELPAARLESFTLQARARFSIVRPDGAMPATHSPQASWCAVYCVASPAPSHERQDSGVLRMYESRLGTMFSDASNASLRLPYTPGHFAWPPVPGEVAIFPGWIAHEIALIRASGDLVLVTARARFVAPGQQGQSAW